MPLMTEFMYELPQSTKESPLRFFEALFSKEGIGLLKRDFHNRFYINEQLNPVVTYDEKTLTYSWEEPDSQTLDFYDVYYSYEFYLTSMLSKQTNISKTFLQIRLDACNAEKDRSELLEYFRKKIDPAASFLDAQTELIYKEIFESAVSEIITYFNSFTTKKLIEKMTEEIIEINSFGFRDFNDNSKKLKEILYALNRQYSLVVDGFQTIDQLFNALICSDFSEINGNPIQLNCKTNVFCYSLSKLDFFFEHLSPKIIERSKLFTTKTSKKYLNAGLYSKSISSSSIAYHESKKIDEIILSVQNSKISNFSKETYRLKKERF